VEVGGLDWGAVCAGCGVAAGGCVELLDIRDGRAYVRPCQ